MTNEERLKAHKSIKEQLEEAWDFTVESGKQEYIQKTEEALDKTNKQIEKEEEKSSEQD